MSKGTRRLDWAPAHNLALRIKTEIAPYCEIAEIAGSLRRKEQTCGDIEIVVIPLYSPSLIAEIPGQSLLDPVLERLVKDKRLIKANKGTVHKKFHVPALVKRGLNDFKLEIVVSSPERWPVELAIKTGPARFAQKLVTPRRDNGLLPSDHRVDDGWQVWRGDEHVPFKSEEEFIIFCCGQWIPPEERGRL